MHDQIKNLILEAVDELKSTFDLSFTLEENSTLIGNNAVFDSIDFINLITDIEDKIFDEFDVQITLVDEKAFSAKNSPFLNVETLTNHIQTLLESKSSNDK